MLGYGEGPVSLLRPRGLYTLNPTPYAFFSGFPGGLSLVNTSRFLAMKSFHCGGTSSSGKIAVTGHSGSHAPQSMHSSGWM